jgi:Flp pilus assembly pilin Flp
MKSYSLVVALFVLLVVSVSLADPMSVPEDTDGAVEVELVPAKYYSPWVAGFGNLVPSVGYFLIDEPGWAAIELGVIGGGVVLAVLPTAGSFGANMSRAFMGVGIIAVAYFGSIIHAPFLAGYKNNQQKVALDLSPGLGLDSEGEVYPTVQLTLSF